MSGGPPWWPGRPRAWTRRTGWSRTPSSVRRLAGLGDREVEAAARAVAYRLDPRAFVDRTRGAHQDRTVYVAAGAGHHVPADRVPAGRPGRGRARRAVAGRPTGCRAEGDPRSRGQIMADTLVQRVTGQATAAAVPVEVQLVMSEETLLGGGDEPADLVGAGPVPAAGCPPAAPGRRPGRGTVWLRRVYTRPADGSLVAMDSTAPRVPRTGCAGCCWSGTGPAGPPGAGPRSGTPTTSVPVADGGRPPRRNGQGLCEACNYTKQAPGWTPRPGPDGAGDRWSRSPPPPATPTPATHHRCPATRPATTTAPTTEA